MTKIMTAINNPELNEELKQEENVEIICRDIQYKEGILEILENNIEIDYLILDINLPGEIEINNLIEKIIEKKEKIKIIIILKKENINKLKINNKKIIKIIYENKINLNKIKNYKNNSEKINNNKNKINNKNINNKKINNKLKNKIKLKKNNKETKIILFFGDNQVGKSMTIINIAYYLKKLNNKILIVELNERNPSIYSILGVKKYNKKIIKKRKKIINKIKIKNNLNKNKIKYYKKYFDKNIVKNLIIKINKNIDLISYNKIINLNLIKKIEKNYNYILIEINLKNNKKIINNNYEKIIILNPNLLGIKNTIKIIKKNEIKNFKIILNKYNNYSIDEKIIQNIFEKNKIIGKIKIQSEYENLINKNFKNYEIGNKMVKKDMEKIVKQLI